LPANKKRTWKLQVQTEKDGVRKIVDIAPEDLGKHQFSSAMSYEDAKKRASILNRDKEIKRHAARKANIDARIEKEAISLAVAFPDEPEFMRWAEENYRFKSQYRSVKGMADLA